MRYLICALMLLPSLAWASMTSPPLKHPYRYELSWDYGTHGGTAKFRSLRHARLFRQKLVHIYGASDKIILEKLK